MKIMLLIITKILFINFYRTYTRITRISKGGRPARAGRFSKMKYAKLIKKALQNIDIDKITRIDFHRPSELGIENNVKAAEDFILAKCDFWGRQMIIETIDTDIIAYSEDETLMWIYNGESNMMVYIR